MVYIKSGYDWTEANNISCHYSSGFLKFCLSIKKNIVPILCGNVTSALSKYLLVYHGISLKESIELVVRKSKTHLGVKSMILSKENIDTFGICYSESVIEECDIPQ